MSMDAVLVFMCSPSSHCGVDSLMLIRYRCTTRHRKTLSLPVCVTNFAALAAAPTATLQCTELFGCAFAQQAKKAEGR